MTIKLLFLMCLRRWLVPLLLHYSLGGQCYNHSIVHGVCNEANTLSNITCTSLSRGLSQMNGQLRVRVSSTSMSTLYNISNCVMYMQ